MQPVARMSSQWTWQRVSLIIPSTLKKNEEALKMLTGQCQPTGWHWTIQTCVIVSCSLTSTSSASAGQKHDSMSGIEELTYIWCVCVGYTRMYAALYVIICSKHRTSIRAIGIGL